jgi:hypothetical protein
MNSQQPKILISALLAIIFISCEKSSLERTNPFDENGGSAGIGFPAIADGTVEGVFSNGAVFKGEVISQGAGPVYEKGVCYNYSGNPSLSFMRISAGSGTGKYECVFSGLLPGFTYYLRAYATNEKGTVYGNEVSFSSPY